MIKRCLINGINNFTNLTVYIFLHNNSAFWNAPPPPPHTHTEIMLCLHFTDAVFDDLQLK